MHDEPRTFRPILSLTRCATAGAVSAWLSIAAPVSAQNAKVYVANSAKSQVLSVQFDPASASVINGDPGALTLVRDLAIRDDGLGGTSLIVCDREAGRIVFYQGSSGNGQLIFDANMTAGPARPDGISLDASGNVFVLSSGLGDSGCENQVWVMKRDPGCPNPKRPECLGGGYRTPLGLIDPSVKIVTEIKDLPRVLETDLLPESLVAPSAAGVFNAGDLLVLTNPGALVRYHAADIAAFLSALEDGESPAPLLPDTIIHPYAASVPLGQRFPAGAEPTGMAFAPGGGLLIPVSDGRILIYGPDGLRRPADEPDKFVDFTAGEGPGEFKIAVGLQDGKSRAYVTYRQKNELRRYTIGPDGRGIPDAVVEKLSLPVGVDATNSNTVPAAAGNGVTVAPTDVLTSKFEKVLVAGQVNATVSTFPDPREREQSIPHNLPLHRSLFLNELRADLPPIEIPAYARAFPFDNPNTGTPTFILVEASSNVGLSGLVDHLGVEADLLGYDPNCADHDITKQPFMFWAPDADDPPIVEGPRFIDITTGCGTIRGLSRNMSYFLVGVRITAPMKSLVGEKLAGLRAVITGSSCIDRHVQRKLESLMDHADQSFQRKRYALVAISLWAIDALVERSPKAFSSCAQNTGGEIQARARSAIFALTKVP